MRCHGPGGAPLPHREAPAPFPVGTSHVTNASHPPRVDCAHASRRPGTRPRRSRPSFLIRSATSSRRKVSSGFTMRRLRSTNTGLGGSTTLRVGGHMVTGQSSNTPVSLVLVPAGRPAVTWLLPRSRSPFIEHMGVPRDRYLGRFARRERAGTLRSMRLASTATRAYGRSGGWAGGRFRCSLSPLQVEETPSRCRRNRFRGGPAGSIQNRQDLVRTVADHRTHLNASTSPQAICLNAPAD